MMLYREHSLHVAPPVRATRRPPSPRCRSSGVSDQDRIVSAVKRTKSSVVALTEHRQRPAGRSDRSVLPTVLRRTRRPGHVQPLSRRSVGFGLRHRCERLNRHQRARGQPPAGGNTKMTVVFANGDHVPAHVVAANIGGRPRLRQGRQLRETAAAGRVRRLDASSNSRPVGDRHRRAVRTPADGVGRRRSGFNRDEPIPTESGSAD